MTQTYRIYLLKTFEYVPTTHQHSQNTKTLLIPRHWCIGHILRPSQNITTTRHGNTVMMFLGRSFPFIRIQISPILGFGLTTMRQKCTMTLKDPQLKFMNWSFPWMEVYKNILELRGIVHKYPYELSKWDYPVQSANNAVQDNEISSYAEVAETIFPGMFFDYCRRFIN